MSYEDLPTPPPFKENVVILTGASAGIGRELALQLADQGAWLALAARNADALKALADECETRGAKLGCRARAIPTDVGVEADCRDLVEKTILEFGHIETVVHNAGISMWARFDEMQTLAPFEEIMHVNYIGPVWLTHYALPHLKQSKGRLVAISSAAGKQGVPTRSGYAASKHAMVGFFDTLRIELESSGITVTIVYPDFVTSEIRERAFGPDGKPLGKGNSPVKEDQVMSAAQAAKLTIRGIEKRQREVMMSPRSKLGQWLKLIAPQMVDNIAKRAIAEGK